MASMIIESVSIFSAIISDKESALDSINELIVNLEKKITPVACYMMRNWKLSYLTII